MVEGGNLVSTFENQDRFINEDTIAYLMQDMLNTAYGSPLFSVNKDEKARIDAASEARIDVVMTSEISAYSIIGAKGWFVNVTLNIAVPTENLPRKTRISNAVNKLLGNTKIAATVNRDGSQVTYNAYCSFRRYEAGGDVQNINAEYTKNVRLRGQMYLAEEGGGVIGDRIFTYIRVAGKDYQVVVRGGSEGKFYTTENPVRAGNMEANTEYISSMTAKQLNVIFTDDYIGNLLRDWAKGELADADNPFLDTATGKPVVTVVEYYPSDHTFTTAYYVTSIQESREMGTLTVISLSLVRCV